MTEKEQLPENRRFKTLASIPKGNNGYLAFKSYIQLEDLIFSKISNSENLQNFYNEIISIIERKTAQKKHLFIYMIDLVVYSLPIRPKQAEIASKFLSILFLTHTNKQKLIINTIKENKLYENTPFIQKIIYTQGLLKRMRQFKKPPNPNEVPSIETILEEDNLSQLKEIINSNKLANEV